MTLRDNSLDFDMTLCHNKSMRNSPQGHNQNRQCSAMAAHASATSRRCPRCGGQLVLWRKLNPMGDTLWRQCWGMTGRLADGCTYEVEESTLEQEVRAEICDAARDGKTLRCFVCGKGIIAGELVRAAVVQDDWVHPDCIAKPFDWGTE